MAHAHLHDIEAETAKAIGLLIGTLMGGLLVVSSFVVAFAMDARELFPVQVAGGGGARAPDGVTGGEGIAESGRVSPANRAVGGSVPGKS